jgi:hypothetical protein
MYLWKIGIKCVIKLKLIFIVSLVINAIKVVS